MVNRESLNVIFQEGDLCLGDVDERTYLLDGERSFWLSDHPYEPCLYVKTSDGASKMSLERFQMQTMNSSMLSFLSEC